MGNKNEFGFAMGILAGVLGGVALGVLFAPKKGAESRKELMKAIDELKEKYSPEILEAKKQAMELINNSKNAIEVSYDKLDKHIKAKKLAKAKNNETQVDSI